MIVDSAQGVKHPMFRPRVKICCITSVEEALLAVKYGASAVGLVSEMPSGPGIIGEKEITFIARKVPPGIATFLLTSRQDVKSIIDQQRRLRTNTLQLCDSLTAGTYDDLRRALPGIGIVQVIHVTGPESATEGRAVAPFVDAILLDSGNRNVRVRELGGTGRTHDWSVSSKIRADVNVPVYLAGGLNADNVADAVETVRPFGLDVCTGVRTAGRLDEEKLNNFFLHIQTKADGRDSA